MIVSPPAARTVRDIVANGMFILALAIVVRLIFCFLVAPRQVCGLNDANQLILASALEHVARQTGSWNGLGTALSSQFIPHLGQVALEAISRTGPLYPAYLGWLLYLFHLNADDLLKLNAASLVAANCISDSLNCLGVYWIARLMLNRRAAAIAGVIACFYPGAVINCMHCYSEPFCELLVSAWLCFLLLAMMRHVRVWLKAIALFCAGALSVAIALTVPALALMPIFTCVFLFALLFGERINIVLQLSGAHLERISDAPQAVALPAASTAEETDAAAKHTSTAGTEGAAAPVAEETGAVAKLSSSEGTEVAATPAPVAGESQADMVAQTGGAASSDSQSQGETDDAAMKRQEEFDSTPASLPPDAGNKEAPAAPATGQPSRRAKTGPTAAQYALLAAAFVGGVVIAAAPWLLLHQGTPFGAQFLCEPSIASDFWVGSMLATDGWKILPGADFPVNSVRTVVHNLLGSIISSPVPYTILLLQKVPRLWCGCWNDYQLTYFGAPLLHNVFHCVLLFLGFCGLALGTLKHPNWRLSRLIPGLVAMSSIIVYHFFFCFLNPVSRNALTAMPVIFVLAAYCIELVIAHGKETRVGFLKAMILAAVLFSILLAHFTLVPFIEWGAANDVFARIIDVAVWIIAWIVLLRLTIAFINVLAGARSTTAADLVKYGMFWVILIVGGCATAEDQWKEWSAELKSDSISVAQIIALPAQNQFPELTSDLAFVMIDASAVEAPPPIRVSVNSVECGASPIPWLQLRPIDNESRELILRQSRGMGIDWRNMRQWWLIPFPADLLKFGQDNLIEVAASGGTVIGGTRVFGDYNAFPQPALGSSFRIMPSPHSCSWQKGFATYCAGDIRLFEPVALPGKAVDSFILLAKKRTPGDLSFDRGHQSGAYRVRIAFPTASGFSSMFQSQALRDEASRNSLTAPVFVLGKDQATGITGSDAPAQSVSPKPVALPSNIGSGALIALTCEYRAVGAPVSCAIRAILTGKDPLGHEVDWESPWQPACEEAILDWKTFQFAAVIPDEISSLSDLKANVQVLPYDAQRQILHPQDVRKQTVAVRNLELVIAPPLFHGGERERDWTFF